ncbi:hypothetical protein JCGZ_20141 [Jatropha curcas]|uniref:Uncharacterized protein n=1 Tax=Jatropha curcas TaxID=180498 RepID=A0A067JU55_JATCU|nr:hypothetical protein JCGZ_20141 [Jatropha curcas]
MLWTQSNTPKPITASGGGGQSRLPYALDTIKHSKADYSERRRWTKSITLCFGHNQTLQSRLQRAEEVDKVDYPMLWTQSNTPKPITASGGGGQSRLPYALDTIKHSKADYSERRRWTKSITLCFGHNQTLQSRLQRAEEVDKVDYPMLWTQSNTPKPITASGGGGQSRLPYALDTIKHSKADYSERRRWTKSITLCFGHNQTLQSRLQRAEEVDKVDYPMLWTQSNTPKPITASGGGGQSRLPYALDTIKHSKADYSERRRWTKSITLCFGHNQTLQSRLQRAEEVDKVDYPMLWTQSNTPKPITASGGGGQSRLPYALDTIKHSKADYSERRRWTKSITLCFGHNQTLQSRLQRAEEVDKVDYPMLWTQSNTPKPITASGGGGQSRLPYALDTIKHSKADYSERRRWTKSITLCFGHNQTLQSRLQRAEEVDKVDYPMLWTQSNTPKPITASGGGGQSRLPYALDTIKHSKADYSERRRWTKSITLCFGHNQTLQSRLQRAEEVDKVDYPMLWTQSNTPKPITASGGGGQSRLPYALDTIKHSKADYSERRRWTKSITLCFGHNQTLQSRLQRAEEVDKVDYPMLWTQSNTPKPITASGGGGQSRLPYALDTIKHSKADYSERRRWTKSITLCFGHNQTLQSRLQRAEEVDKVDYPMLWTQSNTPKPITASGGGGQSRLPYALDTIKHSKADYTELTRWTKPITLCFGHNQTLQSRLHRAEEVDKADYTVLWTQSNPLKPITLS